MDNSSVWLNFYKNMKNKIHHHSWKGHIKCKIWSRNVEKCGKYSLAKLANFVYLYIRSGNSHHFWRESPAKVSSLVFDLVSHCNLCSEDCVRNNESQITIVDPHIFARCWASYIILRTYKRYFRGPPFVLLNRTETTEGIGRRKVRHPSLLVLLQYIRYIRSW